MNQHDILTITDIQLLVDSFYEKVKSDNILGPVFEQVIQNRWPEHLEKMYRFWQTILLDEHTYHGSPFAPHARLPIQEEHFERWLKLFLTTIDDNFTGSKALEAKWRAEKMAHMFQLKMEMIREQTNIVHGNL